MVKGVIYMSVMLLILEAYIYQVKSITTYDTLGRMRITIKSSKTVSLGQVYTTVKKCLFVVIVT